MIAVSDTTPLRYLIAIGQEHLLNALFTKFAIPRGVIEELTDDRTPKVVRRRMLLLPWLEVQSVSKPVTDPFPRKLHKGEHEAILLAEILRPDVLLIDEHFGRSIDLNRNLPVSGTLGVLERADLQGLIKDFPRLLQQLKESGFFIAPALEEQLLKRHSLRIGKRSE
jgi:predicted nucleic acid-binding protein